MELEDKLEDKDTYVNRSRVSTTDPEASIARRNGKGPDLCYKTHRGVDPLNEIITSTLLTTGNVDDGAVLFDMIDIHEKNTQTEVDTVVADSKYGTKNNYLKCNDSGIQAHIPSLEKTQNHGDIFPKEAFIYNPESDTFTCPAFQTLVKKRFHEKRNAYDYEPARGICAKCSLRAQCTRSKGSRSVNRHVRQDDLDVIIKEAQSRSSLKDIKKRQDLSERSFAQSTRYGFKQARWRGLIRVTIQDYLIASIQNIMKFIKNIVPKMKIAGVMTAILPENGHYSRINLTFKCLLDCFLQNTHNISPVFSDA
jgi:hypothetical protein